MNGLWDQPGIPHKGWACVDVIDSRPDEKHGDPGDDYESCQMCGHEKIRFVHVMKHQEHPDELRVGCICAGKMSGDYAGSREREKSLRNKAVRRAKWLNRKWRTAQSGNHYLNVEGFNVVVFPDKARRGNWKGKISIDATGKTIFGKKSFPTEDAAKLALFEGFWKLREEGE